MVAHIREQASWPSVRRKMVRKLQREGAREVQVLSCGPVMCEKTLQGRKNSVHKEGRTQCGPSVTIISRYHFENKTSQSPSLF